MMAVDEEDSMGCFAALLALMAPRFVIVLLQIFTDRLEIAFSSFVLGFLGFLLLPYTTVFYALAYDPILGVEGLGWFIVALGFFFDLSAHVNGARERQRRAAY